MQRAVSFGAFYSLVEEVLNVKFIHKYLSYTNRKTFPEAVLYGGRQSGGFVNSAVNIVSVFVACWNYSAVFDIGIEGTTEGSVGFLITILWI